jgi:hypothetical protein
LALLAAPNDVVLSELEPFLSTRKYVLSTVMRQQGRLGRVLQLLKELAEGGVVDPDMQTAGLEPVEEVAGVLEGIEASKGESQGVGEGVWREYAMWVVGKDVEKGLQVSFLRLGNLGHKDPYN